MPDEVIFAPRLMLPPRDHLFILVMESVILTVYFLEVIRLRIVRYEQLRQIRAARRKTPR